MLLLCDHFEAEENISVRLLRPEPGCFRFEAASSWRLSSPVRPERPGEDGPVTEAGLSQLLSSPSAADHFGDSGARVTPTPTRYYDSEAAHSAIY